MIVIAFIVGIAIYLAAVALGAWILMLLLGTLAALTGWSTAISFWACYVICLIISLFFPKGSKK